jgi:hypothetical protein
MNVEAKKIPTILERNWIVPMTTASARKKEYSAESLNRSDEIQVIVDGLKYDAQKVINITYRLVRGRNRSQEQKNG